MKRLFAAILCLCLLAGCGWTGQHRRYLPGRRMITAAGTEKVEPVRGEHSGSSRSSRTGSAAGQDRMVGSADVYTLSLRDVELTLDGERL